jgi:hypothetical protein
MVFKILEIVETSLGTVQTRDNSKNSPKWASQMERKKAQSKNRIIIGPAGVKGPQVNRPPHFPSE